MVAPTVTSGTPLAPRPAGRLRVLHVIDSLDLGGAQAVLVNLIRHGDHSRFEFEVATMYGHGVYWDRLQKLAVPVHSLSFAAHAPLYVPRLAWLYLSRRYDIVHTHLIGANVIAKPLAALCGVPIRINHDHCNDKLTDPRRWVPAADRLTNRLSTHVIAVSRSTHEYAVKEEQVPASRVSTIYNGIDLEIYRPRPEQRAAARAALGLPPDAFVVAGIGRLAPQKNFSLFLQVAAAVLARNPRAFFVIAGTGGEDLKLRQSARTLGIESRLRFLGYVASMPELYPAVDMLLLTSLYEGLPITILEAMATGTVIVASRLDGVEEILVDAVDGALVPSGDSAAFAARVLELMEQPQIAARYAQAALQKVRGHYSAQSMTRAVEAVYATYLSGTGEPMISRGTVSPRFVSFTLIGLIAAAVQYGILVWSVERLALSPVLGSSLGFATSAICNYWLNYHFTFRSRNAHAGAAGRFALVALSGLGLNALIMLLLGHVPGMKYIVAQLIATALVFGWNFFGHSLWTFARRCERPGDAVIGAGK